MNIKTLGIAFACAAGFGCATAPTESAPVRNTGAFVEPGPSRVANWVDLGPAVAQDEFIHTIAVSDPNPFGELMVKGVAGEPKISTIRIEYPDHSVQQVTLDKRFVVGEGQVIELRQRRAIAKITVITAGNSNGAFTVFGA